MGDVYDYNDQIGLENSRNPVLREASDDGRPQPLLQKVITYDRPGEPGVPNYSDDLAAVRRARGTITDDELVELSQLTEEQAGEADYDPLDGGAGTNIALLITMMRLYDVQLALLSETNERMANILMEKHAAGQIVASFPNLSIDADGGTE